MEQLTLNSSTSMTEAVTRLCIQEMRYPLGEDVNDPISSELVITLADFQKGFKTVAEKTSLVRRCT